MELWSWLLTTVGIIGIFLAGSKNKFGWLLGVFAQVLWFAFAIFTQQYGFILSAFVYGTVYIRNYIKWKSEEAEVTNRE